jgi:hypothetical protein
LCISLSFPYKCFLFSVSLSLISPQQSVELLTGRQICVPLHSHAEGRNCAIVRVPASYIFPWTFIIHF